MRCSVWASFASRGVRDLGIVSTELVPCRITDRLAALGGLSALCTIRCGGVAPGAELAQLCRQLLNLAVLTGFAGADVSEFLFLSFVSRFQFGGRTCPDVRLRLALAVGRAGRLRVGLARFLGLRVIGR